MLSTIAYLFLGVEQMAIEIEGPFGDDANDLPIEEFILSLEMVLMGMRAHNLNKNKPQVVAGKLLEAERELLSSVGDGK